MLQTEYKRIDLHITVRRSSKSGAVIEIMLPGSSRKRRLNRETVQQLLKSDLESAITELRRSLKLSRALMEWERQLTQREQGGHTAAGKSPDSMVQTLSRVTLEIEDARMVGLPWEKILRPMLENKKPSPPKAAAISHTPLKDCPVIRISRVRPQALSHPFTLPLRILQVNPMVNISNWPQSIFRGSLAEQVARLVEIRVSLLEPTGFHNFPYDWPTIEVLHFDHLPTLAASEHLLSTSAVDEPGTLGWFSRWSVAWQTRLIIIKAHSNTEMIAAKRLATALAQRGGPAILIVSSLSFKRNFDLIIFYKRLLHDYPHDLNFHLSFNTRTREDADILVAGAGREEALRFSNIAKSLLQFGQELSFKRHQPLPLAYRELRNLIDRHSSPVLYRDASPMQGVIQIRDSLRTLHSEWSDYQLEGSEQQGVLSLSQRLHEIRISANVSAPQQPVVRSYPGGRRYVNSSLWKDTAADGLTKINQHKALLRVGEIYHLGIRIGLKDVEVQTIGAIALIEEVFNWSPEMKGVWLEVALTSLDFEVFGDAVQELWLPRDGDSIMIYFAVIPRTDKVARLRFSIYHNQNVIQSFRLAALTTRYKHELPTLVRQQRLAKALDIPPESVGENGYLPRLEYSTSTDIQQIASRPARALSIVANALSGKKVLTIKGSDIFGVTIPKDLKLYVEKIRNALKEISTPPIAGIEPRFWNYGWGGTDPNNPGVKKLNLGKTENLKKALRKLADTGWQLFTQVIPNNEPPPNEESLRSKLERVLATEKQVVHVAHTLLEDVLPWSLLYDKPYDPRATRGANGEAVEQDVCLAALPHPDGTLPFSQCEESPRCLLHATQLDERRKQGRPTLTPETVACPLHFWGFKHIIEIPPQQVADDVKEILEQKDCIRSSTPAQLAAGLNTQLNLFPQHLNQLEAITEQTATVAIWKSKKYLRDDIVTMMRDEALDIVYLYCHALGDRAENIFPPYLEFWDQQQSSSGYIYSGDLEHNSRWTHHPLIFLNGCGTVGFNPEALSPFITTLVQNRGASGLIGTEIPVWEQLASEFAMSFLSNFLDNMSAGAALLKVRRELLAQNNPLGLVYTLYGAAHLRLSKNGQCTQSEI